MNIQELAEQAGMTRRPADRNCRTPYWDVVIDSELERFAALVLEEAAKVCGSLQDVPATEPRHCAEDIRIEARALKGAKE